MFVFQFVLQILTACMFSKSGSKSSLVCSKKKIVYIMELLIFEELIMSRKFKYKLCFFILWMNLMKIDFCTDFCLKFRRICNLLWYQIRNNYVFKIFFIWRDHSNLSGHKSCNHRVIFFFLYLYDQFLRQGKLLRKTLIHVKLDYQQYRLSHLFVKSKVDTTTF